MKLFLDTNIILDFITKRGPHFKNAEVILYMSYDNTVELWASGQSFCDAEYILSRIGNREEARRALRSLLAYISIAPTPIAAYEKGLDSDWADLEDYVISATAESIDADYLLTRDADGFTGSSVAAMNPVEFFEELKTRYGVVYDIVEYEE